MNHNKRARKPGDTIARVSVLSLFEQNSYTQWIENVQCISNWGQKIKQFQI